MNNFTRTRNNTNVWAQMTELRSNEPFLQFSYKAMIKATDFLTNHKTQDPQGSKVDVGLDDEIKRLVLPETLSEVASLEKHGGDPELVNFQAILIDRLNRALKFCEFYLKNLSTLENYSGGLGGVILEMNRQLEVIFSENPEIRRLLAEWGDFEQKAVNPNVSVEEREKALKETLKLLEKGGKDLYRAVVLADHLAQITEVLKDYTEKVGPLSPRIVPEYSLKELIFKEIKRKCLLAKKTIYMEEEPEELKKSEIDKVLEKINKDKPNSTTHDV